MSQASTYSETDSVRTALEKCLERDSARRKLVQQKLEDAIRLLKEAMLCEGVSSSSPRLLVTETEAAQKLTNLEIIRASVRTFGSAPFNLSQLCTRVAAIFPGVVVDRQTIARRLFDLRREESSQVQVDSINLVAGQPTKKGRRFIYRYHGPPC